MLTTIALPPVVNLATGDTMSLRNAVFCIPVGIALTSGLALVPYQGEQANLIDAKGWVPWLGFPKAFSGVARLRPHR